MSDHIFNKIYTKTVNKEASAELKSLLKHFYEALLKKPYDLGEVKTATIAVLEFLVSPQGHTDANCRGVDLFICLDDDWENDWSDLPEDYRDIIADMGHFLHDAVTSPNIAKDFGSLPEQLLERAKQLQA